MGRQPRSDELLGTGWGFWGALCMARSCTGWFPSRIFQDFRDVPKQTQSYKWHKADFPEQGRRSISPDILGWSRGSKEAALPQNHSWCSHNPRKPPAGSLLSGMRLGLKVNQLAQLQVRTERKTSRFLWAGQLVCLFGILQGRGRFQAPCPV